MASEEYALTSRAGAALLSALADRLGLTGGLTAALRCHSRKVRHEPGRVVRDLAVMLADGGDCLTDLGALRDQGVRFGAVWITPASWCRWTASVRSMWARTVTEWDR